MSIHLTPMPSHTYHRAVGWSALNIAIGNSLQLEVDLTPKNKIGPLGWSKANNGYGVYPSIYPCVRPSIHPCVRPSIHLSVCQFAGHDMTQLDSSRMMCLLDTVESIKELQKIKDKFLATSPLRAHCQ